MQKLTSREMHGIHSNQRTDEKVGPALPTKYAQSNSSGLVVRSEGKESSESHRGDAQHHY
jgi:hypothetical protein